jgi:hypothetical protein
VQRWPLHVKHRHAIKWRRSGNWSLHTCITCPYLARWPMSHIHTGCIKGRGTLPGPPQRLSWSQYTNVCDKHIDRQTPHLL